MTDSPGFRCEVIIPMQLLKLCQEPKLLTNDLTDEIVEVFSKALKSHGEAKDLLRRMHFDVCMNALVAMTIDRPEITSQLGEEVLMRVSFERAPGERE